MDNSLLKRGGVCSLGDESRDCSRLACASKLASVLSRTLCTEGSEGATFGALALALATLTCLTGLPLVEELASAGSSGGF